MDKTRLEIVCASDAAYFPALGAMIWSLRVNGGDAASLRVWILDGGLPPDGLTRLREAVAPMDLEVIRPCRDRLRGLLIGDHFSDVTYFRLLVPELLPANISRVLYLDADTIITSPLDELAAVSFGGQPILAVQCSLMRVMSHPKALRNYIELGFAPDDPYFNAGVMLMDVEQFRRERLGDAVLEYVRQNAAFVRWLDQDGLNAVLGRRWGHLEPRWNYLIDPWTEISQQSFEVVQKVESGSYDCPAVLHFLSGWKPWHANYPHPAGEIFCAYWNATRFLQDLNQPVPRTAHSRTCLEPTATNDVAMIATQNPCQQVIGSVASKESVIAATAGNNLGLHQPHSRLKPVHGLLNHHESTRTSTAAVAKSVNRLVGACSARSTGIVNAERAIGTSPAVGDWIEDDEFARDVIAGLARKPRRLPSKWFYDCRGIELFCRITEQPEYYLTKCETELLRIHGSALFHTLRADIAEIIELGAGCSEKTSLVLRQFDTARVTYRPFDLCRSSLIKLGMRVREEFSDIQLSPICGDFMHSLGVLAANSRRRRLVLFLGSSIGNMQGPQATAFLSRLRSSLNVGDYALIGFDLQRTWKSSAGHMTTRRVSRPSST